MATKTQTIQEIADTLQIERRALLATMQRAAIPTKEPLDFSALVRVYELYSIPNPNRKAETMAAAKTALATLQQPQPTAAPIDIQPHTVHTPIITTTHTPKDYGTSFLYLVFACVLIWQIAHTAELSYSICVDKTALNFFYAYTHAIGLQFTALLLTIRYTKAMFLIIAALFELGVNLLLYFPQPEAAKILISLMTAGAIFSYGEMFVQARKK